MLKGTTYIHILYINTYSRISQTSSWAHWTNQSTTQNGPERTPAYVSTHQHTVAITEPQTARTKIQAALTKSQAALTKPPART